MYNRLSLNHAGYPALLAALRLSSFPDVVMPRIERMAAPLSSWKQTDSQYQWSVAVPGVSPQELSVQVEERDLTLTLTREEQKGTLRSRLPQDADPDTLSAKLSRGMLVLTVGIIPKPSPRSIDVVEVNDEPVVLDTAAE